MCDDVLLRYKINILVIFLYIFDEIHCKQYLHFSYLIVSERSYLPKYDRCHLIFMRYVFHHKPVREVMWEYEMMSDEKFDSEVADILEQINEMFFYLIAIFLKI